MPEIEGQVEERQTEDKVTGDDWNILKPLIQDGKLTISVNGRKVAMGPAETLAALQKEMAGDEKLRTAAEKERSASEAIEFFQAAKQASGRQDNEAAMLVAKKLGIPDDVAQDIVQGHYQGGRENGEEEYDEEEDPAAAGQPQRREPKVIVKEQPPDPRLEELVKWKQEQDREQIRHRIFSDVDKGVEDDPRFKSLLQVQPKLREVVLGMVRDVVRRRVGLDNQEYGQGLRGQALDEVHEKLSTLGILPTAGALPRDLGAGRTPGSTVAGAVVHPKERPVERVEPTDAKWTDYIVDQLAIAAQDEDREQAAMRGG